MFRELKAAINSFIRVNKDNIEIAHDPDGYIEVNGLRAAVYATAMTAGETEALLPAGSFAVTTHATGLGTIFVSDGEVWQGYQIGGFTRSGGSISFLDFLGRPATNKQLGGGQSLTVTKSEQFSAVRINDIAELPILASIYTDGGSFQHGDEIAVVNNTQHQIKLVYNNVVGDGQGLRWSFSVNGTDPANFLTWPVGAEVLFRFDANDTVFDVMPRFAISELQFKIVEGEITIDSGNFYEYQGKTCYVTAEAIIHAADAPEGFTCDFVQDTTDDVTFDNTLNSRGDNAMFGQYAVVTVFTKGGYVYLVGDTKTI